jgi:hypothetical protein
MRKLINEKIDYLLSNLGQIFARDSFQQKQIHAARAKNIQRQSKLGYQNLIFK